MFELHQNTRTLAVLCAFSVYEPPSKADRRQLPTLERVEPTLHRLDALLATDRYVAVGMQTVTLLNLRKSELLERLDEIREAVKSRPGVNMVVFWSGHGNIHEKSLRLAARNTWDPIEFEDGLGLEEVLRHSGVARVGTWTLFLDACYAGEGLGDVLGIAQELLKSDSGTLRGYGALCSSAPFEKSRDSAFLAAVVGVLEQGPSAAVRAYADREGGGGTFNPFNKLLSLSELFDAVSNEYRANPGNYRRAEPWPILGGVMNPRLFPNPQFQEQQPSRLADSAYRSIALTADLDSHFFPKALGIDNLESGWHFAGRVEATRAILSWMARPPNRSEDRLYVLAADAGTGKSALLGRLIALTDRHYRAKAKGQGWNEAHDLQAGTVPEPDGIDAALSLRNLTPQTLAEHLAGLLGTGSFDSIEGFVRNAVQSYRRPDAAAPCIVLDALDEALDPAAIVFRVVRPLVQAGWKLLVATRRTANAKGANDLIAVLGPATAFALDQDQHSWNDVFVYALGRLRHSAGLAMLADPAARLIADRADAKFLFARIATSSLLRRTVPVTPEQLTTLVAQDATQALTWEVAALDEDFQRNFACDACGATTMLSALAWSEGDGVPIRDGIWAAMAQGVGTLKGPDLKFEEHHLLWLLREAGRFIQESGDGEQAVYRLFHKSLVDHFRQSPWPNDPVLEALDDRIAMTLLFSIHAACGWSHANPYLIRHMPAHLALRPEQEELNKLLLNFDWIHARLNLSGVQALLSDYRLCDSAYPATARLHRTLTMSAHILREHPGQLVLQLLGRIAPGVPEVTRVLDGSPGADCGLPPPSHEGLGISRRLLLQLPDRSIDHSGVDLIDRTQSLDGLLERARASIRDACWVPQLGGLSQAGALVYIFRGHIGNITSLALSADGRTVVSGGWDNTVRLWDSRTGECLSTLEADRGGAVLSAALSADGSTVICCSENGSVWVWDARTRQLMLEFTTLRNNIYAAVVSAAVSADSRTLAAGYSDGTVRIWDARIGELLCVLQGYGDELINAKMSLYGRKERYGRRGHTDTVNSVALSADGRKVVSGSSDGTVRLWDALTGKPLRTLRTPQGPLRAIASVAIGLDCRTVVSGDFDHNVSLWNVGTGELLWTLQGHTAVVTTVALSDDGTTVASGSGDSTVRVWGAQTGKPLRVLQGHSGPVLRVALSADGLTLVSGGDCGGGEDGVRMWDAQVDEPLRLSQGLETGTRERAISADGRTVVSRCVENRVRIWDLQAGQPPRLVHDCHQPDVRHVALSADGRIMAVGTIDGTVRLSLTETGHTFSTLRGPKERCVSNVALSADGCTVVFQTEKNIVRVWEGQADQPLHALQLDGGDIKHMALSGDGRTLVVADFRGNLNLWGTQTGQHLRKLQPQLGGATCVALSTDGLTVVSGTDQNEVRVLDSQTGELLQTITFDDWVSAVSLAEWDSQAVMAVAAGALIVRLMLLTGISAKVTGGP